MSIIAETFWEKFWSRPDPVLAEAGVAGELLVAKVRLGLAILLFMIPVMNTLFFSPERKEALIGVGLAGGTVLLSIVVYFLIARNFNPSWLGFVTSAFDVTMISAALTLFFLADRPLTATNSRVVFEGYFLAIGSTSLRYDKRICVTAGALALVEYAWISWYAANHWNLDSPAFAGNPYGDFSWSTQASRLIMMATAVLLCVLLVSRSQRLLQLATSDPLTGLFNRGYLDDRLEMELERARRYEKPFTVAVIDADHFKQLNDTYGHHAGDLVLKKLGGLLRANFRQTDTCARYGGEEFVILMPETDMATAHRKVETLRHLLETKPMDLSRKAQSIPVSISAGLACYPRDGQDAAGLFAVADERMFAAKASGRNRVVAGREVAVN
jgi:diguanylate cyclase (GGDEF)-like protein